MIRSAEDDNRSALSCRPQKYGCRTLDSYRPSVLGERYLTGEEVCGYLHIPPRNIADPARHEADFLYCHQRAGISLSRNGDTRNTRQKLPACRRPVLTPHGPDATEPGRLGQNVRAPRFCVLFCPSPNDNYFTFTLF